MSSKDVILFYERLEHDPILRDRAMYLKDEFGDQEKLIDAFLLLAEEHGFIFTAQELAAYIYEHGQEVR